jgi:CRISPR-associated endonuclease/helicase Cas3
VIWALALAPRLRAGKPIEPATPDAPYLPRRLVYVVNRRTIVDQATADAEELAKRVGGRRPGLEWVTDALASRAPSSGAPLVVSTLRGAFADNGEWSAGPARAAIVAGTVDMIGSKLLFSAYRAARRQL